MKKHNLIAILLCLAMALSLTACGGKNSSSSSSGSDPAVSAEASVQAPPVSPDTLSLAYFSADGLHPYTCDNTANQMISSLLYEPLFSVNDSFETESCLARSCTTTVDLAVAAKDDKDADKEDEEEKDEEKENEEDEKPVSKRAIAGRTVCTIQLRGGVRFSDGGKLTASDVVYSLEQARLPGSIYADRLRNLQEVEAVNDETVELTLSSVDAAFELMLDIPIIREGSGEARFPAGTGPYQVVQKKGNASGLTRNPKWWQKGTLPVKEVGLYQVEDSDMQIFGFGSGAVSMVSTDLTGTGALNYTGQYNVVDYPTTSMIYLGCNTHSGSCRNQNFRQVLTYAVDRETLATKMLSGHAEPAVLPVSPRSKLYNRKLAEKYNFSGKKAREAMKKNYYQGSTQKLIVNSESSFKTALAAELKKELADVGINIEIEELTWDEFSKALKKRNFDLYLGEVKMTSSFDLTQMLVEKGSLNYGGYKNKEMNQLLTDFARSGGNARGPAALKLYKAIAEHAPIIPLCFKNHSVLTHWGTDSTLTPTQQNPFYHFSQWKLTVPAKKK